MDRFEAFDKLFQPKTDYGKDHRKQHQAHCASNHWFPPFFWFIKKQQLLKSSDQRA